MENVIASVQSARFDVSLFTGNAGSSLADIELVHILGERHLTVFTSPLWLSEEIMKEERHEQEEEEGGEEERGHS